MVNDDFPLRNFESEDLEYVYKKLQRSFDIRFNAEEMTDVKTFGSLCEYVESKITCDTDEEPTIPQAFDKLSQAMKKLPTLEFAKITPETKLNDLFPKQNRRTTIKAVEKGLGFKLNVLKAPAFFTDLLAITSLIGLVYLFFDWRIGIASIALNALFIWLNIKLGRILKLETVGELSEKMTREAYRQSRTNPNTFNKSEIKGIVSDFFRIELQVG